VVLDQDMEQTAKDEIVNVRPRVTICDGRVTFGG
jgi:predicted amidohydrolase YtcJ